MSIRQSPFALSLSKGRFLFGGRANEDKELCFDKLSTNGNKTGDSR